MQKEYRSKSWLICVSRNRHSTQCF